MADPVLPDFYRAQVVFQGKTGLSEDVYTNSFVFRNDNVASSPAEVADDIATRLHNFYTALATGQTASVTSYMSNAYIENAYQIKVYDLGDAPPRLPYLQTRTLTGLATAAGPPPPEVAACVSYYAGRPLPRRRGRVYIGPVSSAIHTLTSGRWYVSSAARGNLSAAAAGLATPSVSAPVTWCLLSPTDGNAFEITGGWVDDAPDIQRRRGHTPQTRLWWGAPPVQ